MDDVDLDIAIAIVFLACVGDVMELEFENVTIEKRAIKTQDAQCCYACYFNEDLGSNPSKCAIDIFRLNNHSISSFRIRFLIGLILYPRVV